MNIPTDIIKRINPKIEDPVSQSVIYTFSPGNHIYDSDGDMLFKFPYSKDTYWTHFRINTIPEQVLNIEIILVTKDMCIYTISPKQLREKGIWYDTTWPIPSIKTSFESGIYLKIKPLNIRDSNLSIKLCGFMNLFPDVNNYLLYSSLDTYQFVFSKYEMDNQEGVGGVIYNVENYDYIRDIIDNACEIRMLDRY
jgi:hypothetical protein